MKSEIAILPGSSLWDIKWVRSCRVALIMLQCLAGSAFADGLTVSITSRDNFGFFLPSKPGQKIAESIDSAIAFMTQPNPLAPRATLFPAGFIVSAHFIENNSKGYVQVTGRFNPSAYGLSLTDGGGQYDARNPPGAKVGGYPYFLNLVEPDSEVYCIRACKASRDCKPVTKSCETDIPGDYS
ncbi:hypothetical protein [Burkholderia ubonensis]|uniref:hypothetical protein n=1 Tax=Burkholderia ubonensis TaxID=101571 RepID=UPI0012F8AB8C|nr:hypothetical protein [Burkholderia ubonensis]